MFDIEILGYNFGCNYDRNKCPVVEMEASYEDEFLCMPIEFERDYDAYDWICNWIDHMNDKALDNMIKNFVDELWKEFHKGIPKVYGIRIDITLPIRPSSRIRQHIDYEFKKYLAMKRDEDKLCRELSNSRFGLLLPEHLPYIDTDTVGSIMDSCRYIKDIEKAKQKIKEYEKMKIENVIFNDPATIVFWRDGSKTVVKAQDGEPFDPEKGLAMAIAKKVYGNEGNYYNEFKKFIKDEPKEDNKNE